MIDPIFGQRQQLMLNLVDVSAKHVEPDAHLAVPEQLRRFGIEAGDVALRLGRPPPQRDIHAPVCDQRRPLECPDCIGFELLGIDQRPGEISLAAQVKPHQKARCAAQRALPVRSGGRRTETCVEMIAVHRQRVLRRADARTIAADRTDLFRREAEDRRLPRVVAPQRFAPRIRGAQVVGVDRGLVAQKNRVAPNDGKPRRRVGRKIGLRPQQQPLKIFGRAASLRRRFAQRHRPLLCADIQGFRGGMITVIVPREG
jgi:hypothetical protein